MIGTALAGGFRAAIYCRLSKDDDLQGESASIANQRDMLEKFCEKQGWEVAAVYQDDGFTGLNMERPDLKRMLKAIERKQINLVITKDLSRLGRNYLQTGQLMERTLAKDEERIEVLEKMVLRLYEDMVAGRITDANFNLLLEKTQKEQAELKAKVEKGRKHLADEIRLAVDARQWVESIQEYRDITELDASTLNRLIKEIVVHETIGSDKTRHISIEIHFNLKPIPEVEQVTG